MPEQQVKKRQETGVFCLFFMRPDTFTFVKQNESAKIRGALAVWDALTPEGGALYRQLQLC